MPLRFLVLGLLVVFSSSLSAQTGQSGKPVIASVDNNQPTLAPAADLTVLENKLGIGTATPAFKLDVVGQINGSGGLCMGGDCRTTWPGAGTSGPWTLSGTSVLYGGGNVGIGSASPAYKLDVTGQINASSGLCISGDCRTSWPSTSSVWTPSGANVSFVGGSVGIGTASPGARLHVAGGLKLGGPTYYGHVNFDAGTGFWEFDSRIGAGSPGSFNYFDFKTDGTSAVVVRGNGNVGIGTTSPAQKLHVVGNVRVDGNIAALYQDVAEWVEATTPLTDGTVVVLDRLRSNVVSEATIAYDTRVAGAVSGQPGVLLGEAADNKELIAQSGRVRIKVDASFGPIAIGDLLVTSPTAGHAMRSMPIEINGVQLHRPGTLLGKALESLASGRGEILVLLTLQ